MIFKLLILDKGGGVTVSPGCTVRCHWFGIQSSTAWWESLVKLTATLSELAHQLLMQMRSACAADVNESAANATNSSDGIDFMYFILLFDFVLVF